MIRLARRYEIEAAHRLTDGVREGHACRRLHGHRYVVTVCVEGQPRADGMLVEYAILDSAIRLVLKQADHHDLNTIHERCSTPAAAAFARNPTVELFCLWLAARLAHLLSGAGKRPGDGDSDEGILRVAWIRVEEDSRSTAEWHP